ncbi:SDR family oxidoreductase [Cryptosporangium aurantiacum]|uniref:7-alpha-hydroxysteroid dehydrogenase n=1 Tax=Cryptosporangium aurantiacum TaxID=134849 RepID=A0A1M7RIV9_9ACTN|nr:SDR family oxidoreductase [Cryptosporangium aurantiacum]SHN46265.1 7-alpha-hydroxysteroid dehydrogenase [Cryptosporangium aurantiacum]
MILDRFRLDDRVAVVTGAGRGIGAATAVALAEAGADVLISARTEDDLRTVADRIAATGRKAHVVVADFGDPTAAGALAEQAVDAFGRLDLVVNNVGGEMPRPLLKTSVKRLESAFRFNVSTAHALTTAAVPALLDGGGAIVNISSVMGRLPARGYAAYGTAKAALAHYTKLAAADLAPRIRVNAIAVGSVATSALELVLDNDELRTTMENNTPLRRIGDPEDVAAAVVYLASPAGSYVTGAILEVDGGLRAPNLDLGLPDY